MNRFELLAWLSLGGLATMTIVLIATLWTKPSKQQRELAAFLWLLTLPYALFWMLFKPV